MRGAGLLRAGFAVVLLLVATLVIAATVIRHPSEPAPGSRLTDGGFERGSLAGWSSHGATGVTRSDPHSGHFSARVGAAYRTHGDSAISRSFTVPAVTGSGAPDTHPTATR
jgi:hypothetical protein